VSQKAAPLPRLAGVGLAALMEILAIASGVLILLGL